MRKPYAALIGMFILVLVLGNFAFLDTALAQKPASKAITNIKIAAGRVGDPWYVFGEALGDFINRGSSWLRATVVATPGLAANMEVALEDPLNYISLADMNFVYHVAKKDWVGQRYKNYDKTRFIAMANSVTYVWVTFDKKITKGQDFAGKVIAGARKAGTIRVDEDSLLEEWGVANQVKRVYNSLGERVTALKDGLVDAAPIIVDHIYPATFMKGALLIDLETKGPVQFINTDPQIIDRYCQRQGYYSVLPVKIPPKALNPITQLSELWGYTIPVFFGADERIDKDIIYEVTRIIWESAGKWTNWHAQGGHMTKEIIPASPVGLGLVHPGAKKYYDEHGIKVKDLGAMLR